MSFIDGLPDEVVLREIFPKLRIPLDEGGKPACSDIFEMYDVLNRLRALWATSSSWKTIVEETVEWAAWRLAYWEAEQYQIESSGRGKIVLNLLHVSFRSQSSRHTHAI